MYFTLFELSLFIDAPILACKYCYPCLEIIFLTLYIYMLSPLIFTICAETLLFWGDHVGDRDKCLVSGKMLLGCTFFFFFASSLNLSNQEMHKLLARRFTRLTYKFLTRFPIFLSVFPILLLGSKSLALNCIFTAFLIVRLS